MSIVPDDRPSPPAHECKQPAAAVAERLRRMTVTACHPPGSYRLRDAHRLPAREPIRDPKRGTERSDPRQSDIRGE
jgi:hypothetical protein